MSELVRAGRTHPSFAKSKKLAQCIQLDIVGARFRFLDDVAIIIMDFSKNNTGIMFSFNINAGRGYVYPETELDSYFPRGSKGSRWRFSSKNLKNLFVRVFNLDLSKRYHQFIVNETPDQNNGYFELIYTDK